MNKIRIVHFISSLKVGGAESLLHDLIQGLGFDRYDHHVVYIHPGPHVQRIAALGIPTYQVQGLVCLYDPVFFWRLWLRIKDIKPDLIHSFLWAANFAGRLVAYLLHTPIVCSVPLGVDLDGRIRNLLDRYTYKAATRVIAISNEVAKTITSLHKVDPSRIAIVPNGIDAQAVVARAQHNVRSRADLGLLPEHVVFGSVGRFIPRKNYSWLIERFAHLYQQLPQVRLVIVGLGPEEEALRHQITNSGLDGVVQLVVGQLAYGYFPLFDVFVLASDREGISTALLEAMSFKLPCIVTSLEPVHEVIVSGVSGCVVPAGDNQTFVKTALALGTRRELRQEMGLNAYQEVKTRFSLVAMADSYHRIFSHMMSVQKIN